MLSERLTELRTGFRPERSVSRREISNRCQRVAVDMGLDEDLAPSAQVLAKLEDGRTKGPSGVHLVLLAQVYGVAPVELWALTLPVMVRPWALRAPVEPA